MKDFSTSKAEIRTQIETAKGFVLMLDFDGTLSPIAPTPDQAHLPPTTQKLLEKSLQHFPVVVISGRALPNIAEKVGIPGIIYAGSHGFEWHIDGKEGGVKLPEATLNNLASAKRALGPLIPAFPGMLVEDKRLSVSIHYRGVATAQVADFKKAVMDAVSPYIGQHVKLSTGKKLFELRPTFDWSKGHFAEFIVSQLESELKRHLLPIYVGDDVTDEDVFERLKDAVTIRIGKKHDSKAKYYLANQKKIDSFLGWLLSIA